MINLYQHADGGLYCLLIEDAPGKDDATGDWMSGVIYMGTDGQARWTSTARWNERFANVVGYAGEDDQVWAMIRRCNPEDFAMEDVWAAWHDSETQTNAEIVELAIAACIGGGLWGTDKAMPEREIEFDGSQMIGASIIIGPRHLQHVLQTYEVKREAVEGGYRITIRK
jgi:hypothetical protein